MSAYLLSFLLCLKKVCLCTKAHLHKPVASKAVSLRIFLKYFKFISAVHMEYFGSILKEIIF